MGSDTRDGIGWAGWLDADGGVDVVRGCQMRLILVQGLAWEVSTLRLELSSSKTNARARNDFLERGMVG